MKPGTTGTICAYTAQTPFTIRLQEMGLLPKTQIELLRKAPLGDPLEVCVLKQFQLTLSKSEAHQIIVEC